MLDIQTFDARQGGNVLYKALAHPLAAEAVGTLAARLREVGPLAVYDPDGTADALFALHPQMPAAAESYVHDVARLGAGAAGVRARALTDLPGSSCATLLVAAFNAARTVERIRPLLPPGVAVATLDEARIPDLREYCLIALANERQTTPASAMEHFADQFRDLGHPFKKFEEALIQYKEALRRMRATGMGYRDEQELVVREVVDTTGAIMEDFPKRVLRTV